LPPASLPTFNRVLGKVSFYGSFISSFIQREMIMGPLKLLEYDSDFKKHGFPEGFPRDWKFYRSSTELHLIRIVSILT
jgi:hypothetical protein